MKITWIGDDVHAELMAVQIGDPQPSIPTDVHFPAALYMVVP